jgi:hypothetical protein
MEYGRTVVFCAVLFWVTLVGPATWALAPSYDIAVRDLFPLADWQKQFRITDGRDRGKLVPLSLHHAGGAQETWRLDFGDYAGIHLRCTISKLAGSSELDE